MPLLPRHLPGRLAADGYCGSPPEEDSGQLQMRVLSALKVRTYRPGLGEVLIAIRSRGTPTTPVQPGWVAVLSLECDDTGVYAPHRADARPLTIPEAIEVVDFVARHKHERRLVIHCDAGVSRSRSLAAALAELCRAPYRWTVLNEEVVRAVQEAALRRGWRSEAGEDPTSPTARSLRARE